MNACPHRPGSLGSLFAVVGLLLCSGVAFADRPAIEGYSDYDAYRLELESIAASEFAVLESLGRTLGGRDVSLLKIGTGNVDEKPAVLIVGGVSPSHLLGSELAVRVARRLVERAKEDPKARKILDRLTFYVIPRPAPDACEAFFRSPYTQREGNRRSTDDDRDGEVDEDGPDDLDGDGWITMIRVAEPSGSYMPHPDDPRVLIEADAKRNERGRWSLYVEGRDNDADEQQGEDGPGGVAFNRNFTHNYPYFSPGAGPHQVSEIETRAVADFAFSHANIVAVVSFTPEDNLMNPWKPGSSSESQRVKTSLQSDDAPLFDYVAEQYREIHGGQRCPDSPEGQGSFSNWAYFHYGRWSFACRGWWIPEVKPEEEKSEKEEPAKEEAADEGTAEKEDKDDKGKSSKDERGAEDLNALRWFAREGIDGFVDWKRIEHPDFPRRKVEVGGFKPFLRLNPPANELDPLAEKHWKFVCRLAELLPKVTIGQLRGEPLGEGAWRIRAEVLNRGYLPTVSSMGRITREPHPLQIQLQLPPGGSLVTGHARSQLPTLSGRGGRAERTWLVHLPKDKPATLRVRVWSPSVGTASKRLKLTGQPAAKKKAVEQNE